MLPHLPENSLDTGSRRLRTGGRGALGAGAAPLGFRL